MEIGMGEILRSGLEALSLLPDETKIARFLKYHAHLQEQGAVMNLTAIKGKRRRQGCISSIAARCFAPRTFKGKA